MVQKADPTLGRPRGFDTDQALDAAVKTFLVHGYEGATLDHLTAAMRIGRPSLYAAFGDKRQLFGRALHRYAETTGLAPITAFNKEADLKSAVQAFLATAVSNNTCDPDATGCLFACSATAAAQTQAETRSYLNFVVAQTQTLLRGRFAAAIADQDISAEPSADARAAMMVDVMQGMAIRARMGVPASQLLSDAASYAWIIAS